VIFRDRTEAANQLAERLAYLKGRRPLVLAIPRGAVPMGRIIADRLGGDLDVVLVRKLRSAFNPEFAIGAIDENGDFELSADAAYASGSRDSMEREKAEQLALIRERRAAWSALRAPANPEGRVVVVVDDGLATGATMIAALRYVRRQRPALLVCAVPVASTTGIRNVRDVADEVVVVHVPEFFGAVSRFYEDFSEVEDEAVAQLLAA
jgi:predicted phosphoribosyltransferase